MNTLPAQPTTVSVQQQSVYDFGLTAPEPGQLRRTYDIVNFAHTLLPANAETHLPMARGLLKRNGRLQIYSLAKPADLVKTVEQAGFFVLDAANIDGTVSLLAAPEVRVTKVNIYGPPGVGDVIWTLNKIAAIREREAPCRINYTVCANQFAGERSFDLLNNCGLIDSCSFEERPLPRGLVCPDVAQPTYNLFANPHVDAGKPLGQWLPEYATDFDIKFELPEVVDRQVQDRMHGRRYATVYFSSNAWNNECTAGQAWTPKEWAATCIYLNKLGIKPVVMGREWDATYASRVAEEIITAGEVPSKVWINMIDKTPLLLALGLMKHAVLTVGSGSSGLTITAAYLGYNVLTFWPKPGVLPIEPYLCSLIKDGFSTKWMPPDVMALGKYTALHFGEYTLDDVKRKIDEYAI